MVRRFLGAAMLAGAPVLAGAQSISAPLAVTATVVSSCKVEVPTTAALASLPTLPVIVTCARGRAVAHVHRPSAPRSEVRDAVLIIEF